MSIYTKLLIIFLSFFSLLFLVYFIFMGILAWHSSQIHDKEIMSEFAFTCSYQVGTKDSKKFQECIRWYMTH